MAIGCYIPTYLPASFKGVPFDAMEASSEHGRRGAVGEFPFGEDTAYADLGRKANTYSIQARFVENNHVAMSAMLIAAVESPGPGPLVHPTRGLLTVACTSLKVRDNVLEEQGVTYADMEFVEANEFPSGLSLGGGIFGAISEIGGALFDAVGTVFNIGYAAVGFGSSLAGLAGSVLGGAVGVPFHRLGQVLDTASFVIGTIRNEFARANRGSVDSKIIRALMDFDTITADTERLKNASIVHSAIQGGIGAIARSLPPEESFEAMRRLVNSTASSVTLPGSAGTAQAAIYTLTRVIAGAYMAQAAIAKQYMNSSEASADLEAVRTVLTDEARIAYDECQNELFLQLRNFNTTAQTQMFSKIYVLPGVVVYDFSGSVHPLVAAYNIFGDAKQHRQLEKNNILSTTGRFNHNVIGTIS